MNVRKIDRSVLVDEKAMRLRKENLYKLVKEIMDSPDSDTLIVSTLTKIAFIDYLLGLDVIENNRLNSIINVVNNERNTNYQLHDFYIRF